MSTPRIPDVLANRYASPRMRELWSPEYKIVLERQLWIAVLKAQRDLGIDAISAATDRAMICGSLDFNIDIKAVLEGFGLEEGANSDPRHYVVEKAFVG